MLALVVMTVIGYGCLAHMVSGYRRRRHAGGGVCSTATRAGRRRPRLHALQRPADRASPARFRGARRAPSFLHHVQRDEPQLISADRGRFGSGGGAPAKKGDAAEPQGEVEPISAAETVRRLREAKSVIIVPPGYGMAVPRPSTTR